MLKVTPTNAVPKARHISPRSLVSVEELDYSMGGSVLRCYHTVRDLQTPSLGSVFRLASSQASQGHPAWPYPVLASTHLVHDTGIIGDYISPDSGHLHYGSSSPCFVSRPHPRPEVGEAHLLPPRCS